jgi:cytochrome c-type biogenesis protein CcmF
MIPEIGSLCLYLSLALSLIIFSRVFITSDLFLTKKFWLLNCAFIFLAFLCLIYSFAISDFSVRSVADHSHLAKPLIYKISAAWGHHEGSMLMWLSALALFSVIFIFFSYGEQKLIVLTSGVQALILALFTIYTLFASNPFTRIFPIPINGLGLNPLLQDIGLALHPPMLYLGYVGFSVAFSSAVAMLLQPGNFRNWVRMISPWVTLSWSFLTLGVGLGSWWAYRELGWGGFWFWDPVENASLMPWLASTALLHSLAVSEKQDRLCQWSLFLSILTFSLSMVGTFLVRSGIITSVHSFAVDPTRGVYVLSILSFLVIGAMAIFSLRAHLFKRENQLNFISRETFIIFNNIFLFTAAVIVFIGTLYPFALEIFTQKQIAIGAPYYNKLFAPLVLFSLICAIVGSDLAWKKDRSKSIKKTFGPFLIALILLLFVQLFFGFKLGLGAVMTLFSVWLAIVMIKIYHNKKPKFTSSLWAMIIAHLGFASIIFGISLNFTYKKQEIGLMHVNQQLNIGDYTLTLKEVSYKQVENYLSRFAIIETRKKNNYAKELQPETRLYTAEKQQTTESAILHKTFYDLYVVIGELQENGSIMVKAFYEPGISFIWFGCLLMFFGGIFSLTYKLTVPRKIKDIAN